ncbi:MAG: hypothetical protein AB7F19_01185 [Candidatus Babeliales bacterium]
MKRLFSILFLVLAISPLYGMENERVSIPALQVKSSIFDRIPKQIAGYLYGLPEFFSVKQQLAAYGIPTATEGYLELDPAVYAEIAPLLKEADLDPADIFMLQLDKEKAQEAPGFIVTNGGIFIDQAWWLSLKTHENALEIKKFFSALMVEQYAQGQYRKKLAVKMVVDGILVSTVIGIVSYTLAPSLCSWMAESVPGTAWLETISTGIATTANQTCDQFYSPSLCIMAGKTAWSSLLTPGVGPLVNAVITAPVARYLAEQARAKALEKISLSHLSDTESDEGDHSSETEVIE